MLQYKVKITGTFFNTDQNEPTFQNKNNVGLKNVTNMWLNLKNIVALKYYKIKFPKKIKIKKIILLKIHLTLEYTLLNKKFKNQ